MSREPYIERRPWGTFEQFSRNERSTVKILTVNPGEEFSLQYHREREEFWYTIDGEGEVTIGNTTYPLEPGKTYAIPSGTHHQIRALGTPVRVLEISLGDFDENDIVRVTDKYGRATP
ncbi:phosphomannose isomerase type II C-terminal cupin domain [Candidatus Wolfebacteria bacterium]|nr:phosphomannose isomerase type II C-terminal cupin domain [Candidatus Wolfebacteria bacterium]